jgi:2-keto-4-pentenoate hydratase/2-oxohepta-3-ene-1,7-dioic acid hydratase in catechol pathway
MKLVTFERAGARRIGAILPEAGAVVDLQAGAILRGAEQPYLTDMLALIDAGPGGLDAASGILDWVKHRRPAEAWLPAGSVRLLAPVPEPRQMRDCLVFEKHAKQARERGLKLRAATFPDPVEAEKQLRASGDFTIPPVWYQQPVYYKSNRFSVIGTEAEIHWPSYSKWLDYELEFGIWIGKRGKNIPRDKAREHIYGYSIFNDVSARDAQYVEMASRLGPAKGKDFDTGNVLGPWLVTADEVPDPYALTMVARINGEEWSRGSSGDMHHKFEDILAHVTREETIHPGEFIGSGTVGNGCGLELDRKIKPGDLIELEVTGLGVLRNRLVKAE